MAVRPPRLPGIRFETVAPPPTDVLPRMDVAALVGFSASGPLHTPVAVEDAAQFSSIFGDDLTLAWDQSAGGNLRAYLAPAVRAFFRNGGKRCWVVRVASEGALSNEFPIPGLVARKPDGTLEPAVARARSEGTWSDSLRVGSSLVADPVSVLSVAPDFRSLVVVQDRPALVPGDLLRVPFNDAGLGTFFGVDQVSTSTPSPGSSRRAVATLQGSPQVWFRLAWPRSDEASPMSTTLFSGPSERAVPTFGWSISGPSDPSVTLSLDVSLADAPEPGTLLRVDLDTGEEVWLTVESVRDVPGPGSPSVETLSVTGRGLWRSSSPPGSPVQTPSIAHRLSFEIQATLGDTQSFRLDGLAFGDNHPLAWSALPTDATLFPQDELTRNDRLHADLWASAASPRFPLAGPPSVSGAFYLPVAMPSISEPILGPLPTSGTPLERDGLDRFHSGLFLDPGLIDASAETLMSVADDLRYRNPTPRRLQGIHSVLSVDEAVLVAVPDSVHRGWSRSQPDEPPPLPSPPLQPPQSTSGFLDCNLLRLDPPRFDPIREDAPGTFTLSWTSNVIDGTFVLEEADSPDFAGSRTLPIGLDNLLTLHGRSPGDYYYRVRVESGAASSDWSEGVAYRVASASVWQVDPTPGANAPNPFLDVQRALLRLCSARGDLFAVLALPESVREDEAVALAEALRSPFETTGTPAPLVQPIGFGEARALSFGAIVHPWLYVSDPDDPESLRLVPPDGALCGLIAARSLNRGAWIAPANQPIRGVAALSPPIARDRWLDLQEARVNLVRQEPRGFVTLDASTLSDIDQLRPISVRRLLILVRRLALKLGPAYVFEPHDDILRALVRKGFESALHLLFERGAFAGSSPSTSYQVNVDTGASADLDADQGRLVVELRLAPSQPLTFLTVRLVQQGDRSLVMEVS